MKLHLSPEKKSELLRLLQGPVKFMKLDEPQKRAMRMQIEWKVGNLLEIRRLSAGSFMEHLQMNFYSLFEDNYGLEKQIKALLERHWDSG